MRLAVEMSMRLHDLEKQIAQLKAKNQMLENKITRISAIVGKMRNEEGKGE